MDSTTIQKPGNKFHITIAFTAIVIGFFVILGLKLFTNKLDDNFEKATSDAQDIIAIFEIGVAKKVAPGPLCSTGVAKSTREKGYGLRCGNPESATNLMQAMVENGNSLALVPLRDYLVAGAEIGFPGTIIAVLSGGEGAQPNVLIAGRDVIDDHVKGVSALLKNYFNFLKNEPEMAAGLYTLEDNASRWFGIGDTGQEQLIAAIESELHALQKEDITPKLRDNNPYRLTNRAFIQELIPPAQVAKVDTPVVEVPVKAVEMTELVTQTPSDSGIRELPTDSDIPVSGDFVTIQDLLLDMMESPLMKILSLFMIITGVALGVMRADFFIAIPGVVGGIAMAQAPSIIRAITVGM